MGECIITDAGLDALVYASVHGTTIKPSYFKFSNSTAPYVDMSGHLDPTVTAMSGPDVWYTHSINYYKIIDLTANLVEFICEALPDAVAPLPNDETWVCGLFLDDDTLFMMAMADAAFPAEVHQIFRVELAYNNAGSLVEFVYPAINTFLLLADTPMSYAAQAGKLVRVKSTEDQLEFADGIASFLDIDDLDETSYTGEGGNALQVNLAEDAIEFTPVNDALVERAYEDLAFVAPLLSSEPRDTVLEYFDTGYSGTYATTGAGALAKVTIDKATGTKTAIFVYDVVNEVLDTVTCNFDGTNVVYTCTYDGTTGNLTGVEISIP